MAEKYGRLGNQANEFRIELVDDEVRFSRLEEHWNNLFSRAESPRLTQSFEWCISLWKKIFQPSGGRLHCVLIWRDEKLVLIFPIVSMRWRWLWDASFSLAADGDYTDALIDRSCDSQGLLHLAWKTLRATSKSDLIMLKSVRTDSNLHNLLISEQIVPTNSDWSPYISFQRYASWEAYWRSREKSFRGDIDRRYRRLGELNQVTFHVVSKGEQYQALVKWTFEHKRLWQSEKSRRKPLWLQIEAYEDFFVSGSMSEKNFGGLYAFALYSGDRIIAAQINRVDAFRVECVIVARDLDFAKYGVGLLLAKSSLEWAYKNGLMFDFLFGEGEWKNSLSDEYCGVIDVQLTETTFGRIHQRLELVYRLARRVLFLFPRLVRSTQRRGIRETIIAIKRKIFRRVKKLRSFDRINGTDTDESVPLNQLDIDGGIRRHGEKYEPSPPGAFAKTLDSLGVCYKDYTFIDFGSGKGRALLLASSYPFKKIIGVEVSPELHAVAQNNISHYRNRKQRCFEIESVCVDAEKYDIPPTPTIYYFFNPFDDKILRRVLTKIKKSLVQYPRDAMFIYYNPKHAHVFEEFEFPNGRVVLVKVQPHDLE